MSPDDINTRTPPVLASQGLSLCEHFVMCEAAYRTNAPPEPFARFARGSSSDDARGTFSAHEYRAALESCLRRGLLRVLGPGDFDTEGRRRDLLDTPLAAETGFHGYAPGDVDFTAEGYRLHRTVIRAIFGEDL